MVMPTRENVDRSDILGDCWSHLTKHQVLINVLADRPWWNGFDRVCATYGKDLTIKDKGFCHDARILFNRFNPEDRSMSDQTPQSPRSLEQLILRMVTSWLTGRLESKYHLSWNTVKGTPQEADYEEKKTKLATQAFLAARSRPGREFARWFTATLCSVNQRSISSETDFVALAQALDEQPDHVRSLTLLALSARG
jgi:CRISPR-associated protein Cmx8